ncbi:H-type lectin domain-containing protein [Sulfitobacter albidus]|uniref:H-type lectin domain-containing protein n=1 Tax=Sulfitobacter albidus TaxID=2829501 RepID=A0A975JC46_9RHOB|nr:H-type lectin domain-containing protein [Sulfitobacter albidus]QUJ75535.1 H-type lectin domain-containing protein [Sulfitobacter albidus]
MKKLRASIVGIDSGDEVLFEDFEDGGEMWTGRGQRERRRRIKFSESYLFPPTVHLTISLWDMDAGAILRADVTAESVTEKSFDMVFRTWGDTRIARTRIAWMSVGELEDPDAWDVG